MYMYPTRLQPRSNREDFLEYITVFDDDTGNPINLSGTIGSGTFSSWNVTAGNVITTSTTPITIPTFPIGNQLSSLSLTVPASLAITAGNPITISDPSGANQMFGYVLSYNATTGALVALIGNTFQFEIRRGRPREGVIDDYSWFFDFGTLNQTGPVLPPASLGNGILITDLGTLQILIPESQFKQLSLFTYLAAITMTNSQDTRQIFIAELPVIYGGVTT